MIDVGKVTEREIRDCAMKKQKSIALIFPSLIMGICEALGVQFKDNDERIKNEKAITLRTVKRIARESTTAATLECPTTARTTQATGIENML